jgi:ubiquinone/menaquinone biosynthesis C-methylase UbiE
MRESEHIKLNKEKWNKRAETADRKSWLYDYLRRAQEDVISLAQIIENINFLDIGCGTGWAVGQAAKAAGYKGMFYGVDLSPMMIEKAGENFKAYNNLHFIQSSSESIPLDDNLFDIIICTNSFHHYLHPEKSMKEISRLLKSGGKIFILDPVADSWHYRLVDKIIKIFEPQHVKMYSTAEFKSFMLQAGLKYIGGEKIQGMESVFIGLK